jgi:hypothetical protein
VLESVKQFEGLKGRVSVPPQAGTAANLIEKDTLAM